MMKSSNLLLLRRRLVGNALWFLVLCLLSSSSSVQGHNEIYEIHGSGTTNPSKCFWLIMQQFMDRAKVPLRMTYRAVGSSTGQNEFMGTTINGQPFTPSNDFGAGDIPMSTEDYDTLSAAGVGFVHLPFVLGAISVFHSIPNVPDGVGGLNLTSCLLARIFWRDITVWDHPDILKINPNLSSRLPRDGFPITVAHRRLGSSSTASFTAYMNSGCPEFWPAERVKKELSWPADTVECEGSGGMTKCIRDTPGTIGYIDSGHGHSEGLVEIELQNKDGNYLSSKEASARGGIGAAAGGIPGSADMDFGGVDLLNQPGADTWPIVTLSYVYVRKDLSFISQAPEQSLLLTFLRALYEPTYIDQCVELFGFTAAPEGARSVGLSGISLLQVNTSAPVWAFESNTVAHIGQGEYVISEKRRTYTELEATGNTGDIATLTTDNENLRILVGELRTQMASVQSHTSAGIVYTEKDADQLRAALVLSALSFTFLAVIVGGGVCFWICSK